MNKLLKIKNFIPFYLKAMRDKDTPILAKILGVLAIIYALVPTDMIPDIVPVLGIIDDVVIFPLLIKLSTNIINNKKKKSLK